MAGQGRYSATVRWLKIGLPLAALALMSTIFLIDEDTIDIDLPPLSELEEGGRVSQSVLSADLSGQTEAGEPYRVLSDAVQQVEGGFLLDAPRVRLDSLSQGRLTVLADDGSLNLETDELALTGGVVLTVEAGEVELRSEDMAVGLDGGALTILSPLEMHFAGGRLSANSARRAGNPPANDTIWFEGDVRLFVEGTPPHSEN